MNKELMEALNILEKEKEISKETLFEAIENSLLTACKNHFGKADNITVQIDRETCDFMGWMWLTIVLSFGFYIPVVLWADAIPLIGMLMIPKTCAYVWTVLIGYSAMRQECR